MVPIINGDKGVKIRLRQLRLPDVTGSLEILLVLEVHGTEGSDPQAILDLGIASFGEWRALHQVSVQQQVVGSEVWLPPQLGYLNLNGDAVVSLESDHIRIVVETDAINVVSAVSEVLDLSLEGPILEDVKVLLAQLRYPIHHIRCSANHVAHLLAKFGFNSNCTNVLICNTPFIVSNVISFDVIA
ncbi:hypothetical protein TIFTF001_024892 [Ficus carica]|uniref:RNase H type-1 domain-containing protein n=1 Tax=Ficus carica TaxID=3494 RepID=A0AA88AN64_FICCA|nr:hypothetical protein TIFTF001_024892 [Ficus carica]